MSLPGLQLLSEEREVGRGQDKEHGAGGGETGKERFPRPRPMKHPGTAADGAQSFTLRPLQQDDADHKERERKVDDQNGRPHTNTSRRQTLTTVRT